MRIELTHDQSLVLFDWIARLDEANALPVDDAAEEQVLWRLQAQLEKALSEQFRPNYRELVEEARARVRASFSAG